MTIDSCYINLAQAANAIISSCLNAWQSGMMSGWSGNASMRITDNAMIGANENVIPLDGQSILITAAGRAKGCLTDSDLLLLSLDGNLLLGSGSPSSESAMHLHIYKAQAECNAILHTHPQKLQALSLALTGKKKPKQAVEILRNDFLNIDLYEAQMWRSRLFIVDAFEPGSSELAQTVAQAASEQLPCAIWLHKHGLCAIATNMADAFCLSEELEHLAATQLDYLRAR